METEPTRPVKIFFSYAHQDELLRDEPLLPDSKCFPPMLYLSPVGPIVTKLGRTWFKLSIMWS